MVLLSEKGGKKAIMMKELKSPRACVNRGHLQIDIFEDITFCLIRLKKILHFFGHIKK